MEGFVDVPVVCIVCEVVCLKDRSVILGEFVLVAGSSSSAIPPVKRVDAINVAFPSTQGTDVASSCNDVESIFKGSE